MTPRKPYNELLSEKLNNIPLPDEDMAWEEMKKLLDEDDRKRPLVPMFLRGCLPWAILGILLSLGILVYFNFNDWNKSSSAENSAGIIKAERNTRIPGTESTGPLPTASENSTVTGDSTSVAGINSLNHRETITQQYSSKGTGVASGADNENTRHQAGPGNKGPKQARQSSGKTAIMISSGASASLDKEKKIGSNPTDRSKPDKNIPKINTPEDEKDLENNIPDPGTHFSDSTVIMDSTVIADTLKQKTDSLTEKIAIKDSTGISADSSEKKKKKSPFTFSAGLAINQGIPLNGEKSVPYNHYGRRSSIADYLPSVYVRLQKPKWFIQGEFRYGTPQNVKEFVYRSKTDIDTFQTSITTTSSLKKTYYHQVPLTFHYNILKNWSVGAGIAYNRFSKAVRQENVRLAIPGTTIDTLLESNIVTDGRDSAFISHSFQWVVETQYKWKRISLGLRFSQGLQPYIKYTDPLTGLPAEKKNMSLNAFLRFELVRSKKK